MSYAPGDGIEIDGDPLAHHIVAVVRTTTVKYYRVGCGGRFFCDVRRCRSAVTCIRCVGETLTMVGR